MIHKLISGNNPVKFYQDTVKFEAEQGDNILKIYESYPLYPMMEQPVNIPGIKLPAAALQLQAYYAKTYILKGETIIVGSKLA